MRMLMSLAVLLSASMAASAADLTTIDRNIKKEPTYRGKPKYCLLVFGPEAKTKVWLVVDDDNLYVDRNGDGNLTERGERVPMPKFGKSDHPFFTEQREVKAGDIPNGALTHTGLEFTQVHLRKDVSPTTAEERDFLRLAANGDGFCAVSLSVERPTGRVTQVAAIDARGFLQFADHAKDAPVVHFGGPLQMELLAQQKLVRGDEPGQLQSCIGTPGIGHGSFATVVYTTQPGMVPRDVHPVADIDYGGTKSRIVLKERC
jgi:hypothetical protein